MKKILISFVAVLSICLPLFAGNVQEVIEQADQAAENGKFDEAVEILEKGSETYPESADIYANWGKYLSRQAGQASMMEAGMLSEKAFKQLSKALEIEPGHVGATLNRGILGVNMPKFLGKLDQGICDLEFIRNNYGSNQELYMVSTYYLGRGYLKNEEKEKAAECFKFVTIYGKSTSFFEDAKKEYDELGKRTEKESNEDHYLQGMKNLEENNLDKAVFHLRAAAKEQPDNLELHLLLAQTLGSMAERGYDESIREDVAARAQIAQEVFDVLKQCVKLAPGNDDILFLRGSVSVNLPFFVHSLQTGIDDLSYLAEHGTSAEMRSKAGFVLKQAEEKKKIFELAETGYLAKSDEEREALREKFIPVQSPVAQEVPAGENIKVELVLGYRDQIEPQAAVWVEDEEENYLATLYVSDFAASVKEEQVHLPQWAQKSEFRNLATITGASINCGKHEFYWDFIDYNGNKFQDKKFLVKAEICHWPHVQYTQQTLEVDLDKNDRFGVNGDNYLIFGLSAEYENK